MITIQRKCLFYIRPCCSQYFVLNVHKNLLQDRQLSSKHDRQDSNFRKYPSMNESYTKQQQLPQKSEFSDDHSELGYVPEGANTSSQEHHRTPSQEDHQIPSQEHRTWSQETNYEPFQEEPPRRYFKIFKDILHPHGRKNYYVRGLSGPEKNFISIMLSVNDKITRTSKNLWTEPRATMKISKIFKEVQKVIEDIEWELPQDLEYKNGALILEKSFTLPKYNPRRMTEYTIQLRFNFDVDPLDAFETRAHPNKELCDKVVMITSRDLIKGYAAHIDIKSAALPGFTRALDMAMKYLHVLKESEPWIKECEDHKWLYFLRTESEQNVERWPHLKIVTIPKQERSRNRLRSSITTKEPGHNDPEIKKRLEDIIENVKKETRNQQTSPKVEVDTRVAEIYDSVWKTYEDFIKQNMQTSAEDEENTCPAEDFEHVWKYFIEKNMESEEK